MSEPYVFIATPTFDSKVMINYIDSITSYAFHEIKYNYFFISGDSLINRARNRMITDFYNLSHEINFTHLFWQDSDVGLEANALKKLTEKNVDAIAVPVPLKRPQTSYGMVHSVINVYEEVEPMFYKADYAATGALMLSKKIIYDLIDQCIKTDNFYYEDNEIFYNIFQTGIGPNKLYMSEDWWICEELKKINVDLYVDSSIGVSHMDTGRSNWIRPALPINPDAITKTYKELGPQERNLFWVPNDFGFYV